MLMPCGDGTGPMGLGPGTGRFLGYCAGYPAPGYMNPGFGRGRFGRGPGRGLGWGRGWGGNFGFARPLGYAYPTVPYGTPDPGIEAGALQNQAKFLEEELGAVRERLRELEQAKEEK